MTATTIVQYATILALPLLFAPACSSDPSEQPADQAIAAPDAGVPDTRLPDTVAPDAAPPQPDAAVVSCDPQQVSGEGDATSCGASYALRFAWDGERCAALPGCQCQGADCPALYPSQTECLATRAACSPKPWPRDGLHPLRGVDPTLGDDDLAPLTAIVGKASVVALGESVHTSGGYYWAKHRVFSHLVERHGFRAFAIESPRTDAEKVGDYVATCSGDPRQAVANLFGVWAAESTVALVEWSCQWNKAHPNDRVSFFGFDAQQPWDDANALADFFALTTADESKLLADLEASCNGAGFDDAMAYYQAKEHEKPIALKAHQACLAAVKAARSYLEDNATALAAETSADSLDLARLALVGVESWEDEIFYSEANPGHTDVAKSFEARDRAMAQNFRELRRIHLGAATKTVIWAHNTHIASKQQLVDGYYGGAKAMGTFLTEQLKGDYVAIGLIGRVVEINWPGIGDGPTAAPSAGSAEQLLAAEGYPFLLVDLAPPAPQVPFFEPGRSYELGYEKMVPSEQFGALIYLGRSPKMKAILW